MRVVTLLALSIVLISCGRAAPARLDVPNQTTGSHNQQTPQTTSQNAPLVDLTEPVPNVVGTFEPPSAGVKVTSPNTVLEPLKQGGSTQEQTPTTQAPEPQSASIAQTYIVEPGDTISGIANDKFGIKIADLMSVNNIGDRDQIMPGQELKIPTP